MTAELSFRALVELAGRAWATLVDALGSEEWLTREGMTSLARLAYPVAPFNRPEFAAPAIGLAGAVLSLLLLGVAVSSIATLVVAVFALVLLLTRFYGVSLELGALRGDS